MARLLGFALACRESPAIQRGKHTTRLLVEPEAWGAVVLRKQQCGVGQRTDHPSRPECRCNAEPQHNRKGDPKHVDSHAYRRLMRAVGEVVVARRRDIERARAPHLDRTPVEIRGRGVEQRAVVELLPVLVRVFRVPIPPQNARAPIFIQGRMCDLHTHDSIELY